MSRGELLVKIERLRRKMIDLAQKGSSYDELLRASQKLDKYIVEYQRATRFTAIN